MPELGEIKNFDDGVRVWCCTWGHDRMGKPVVLKPRWVKFKALDHDAAQALENLALLPDGAVIDLEMLVRHSVVVELNRPEPEARLSDADMAWLEGEAEASAGELKGE